jgi:transposase
MLMPVDMRDSLPPDHLVWCVVETVDALDCTLLEQTRRRGGAGAPGYDPRMLFALLVYAYSQGVRSSREIERRCVTDVAFRVLCAQGGPDHTPIARFRTVSGRAFVDLFTQVLIVAARAGLGRFGTVAIDGTKIPANAQRQPGGQLALLRPSSVRLRPSLRRPGTITTLRASGVPGHLPADRRGRTADPAADLPRPMTSRSQAGDLLPLGQRQSKPRRRRQRWDHPTHPAEPGTPGRHRHADRTGRVIGQHSLPNQTPEPPTNLHRNRGTTSTTHNATPLEQSQVLR